MAICAEYVCGRSGYRACRRVETTIILVKGTKASPEALSGMYPSGKQRIAINSAFDQYFRILGNALQVQRSRKGGH